MKRKKLLVTGLSGFVGHHLLKALTEEYEVHALIHRRPIDGHGVRCHQIPNVENGLVNVVAEIRPDICLHLATLFIGHHKPEEVGQLVDSNIRFSAELVQACVSAGCLEFMNIGTIWQNFLGGEYNPVNLYAATKEAFVDLLKFYVEVSGLKVLNLKLSDTYGPNDPRRKLLSVLISAATSGETLKMSAGEQYIDLVHIEDVVQGILEGLRQVHSVNGLNTFYLTSGEPLRLKDLVQKVEDVLGKRVPIEWGALPYRPREVFNKNTYEPGLLGWKPRLSLEDGIRTML